METFLMTGRYAPVVADESPVQRKERVESLVEQCGGTLEAMYPLQAANDYAFVMTFRGSDEAMDAEAVLSRRMGIAFS